VFYVNCYSFLNACAGLAFATQAAMGPLAGIHGVSTKGIPATGLALKQLTNVFMDVGLHTYNVSHKPE
jgi:hypothetical protein